MADERGTFSGGSNGSIPDFVGVFLLLEDRKHQARGLVLNRGGYIVGNNAVENCFYFFCQLLTCNVSDTGNHQGELKATRQ